MKIIFTILVLGMVLLSARGNGKNVENFKVRMMDMADKRIGILQNFKSCLNSAQTKESFKRCKKSLKSSMKSMKKDRKEFKVRDRKNRGELTNGVIEQEKNRRNRKKLGDRN